MKKSMGIAVVGLGCWYAGCRSPKEFWENTLAKRREFRTLPDVRTPLSAYWSANSQDAMRFYQPRAAVIDGFTFDWQRYRIPRPAAEVTDVAQLLALEVATQALRDAGYNDKTLPKDKTAVYIGNTNTGEQTRSLAMGMRWPFVERAAAVALQSRGDAAPILKAMKDAYLSVFPEPNEDVGAGSISATIAGRICNHYDLHGGAYALDGACASSLIAAVNGCIALERGDTDLVLCGGVDITLDPLELVAFSRAGALSTTEMRPFDNRANGFVPGEGCGFVVLKRLADAEASNDRIYAVLRGWGTSTDGRGGMMEPTVVGQAAAISRAYEHSPYQINEIDFFEAHGTGTKKGDATEISSIVQVLKNAGGGDRQYPVSSSKATIGHTKAAAGIAGLIRATMAVNRRVVPPTAHCDVPNDVFAKTGETVYPAVSGAAGAAGQSMRAGVNAFGFGGINAHITLESGPQPDDRIRPALDESVLLSSFQQRELFLFASPSASSLRAELVAILSEVPKMSSGDLTDLAAHLSARSSKTADKARAALLAGSTEDLVLALQDAIQKLDMKPNESVQSLSREAGWVGVNAKQPRVGFVYTGQGAHVVGMGWLLASRFAWARERIKEVRSLLPQWTTLERLVFSAKDFTEREESRKQALLELSATELAQPALCVVEALQTELLTRCGLKPAVVAGHSLGELVALHAAGAFDMTTLVAVATLRGRLMSKSGGTETAMVALACPAEVVKSLLGKQERACLANINSPSQCVISGERDAVQEIVARAEEQGIVATPLRVSNAFHSPLMRKAGDEMRRSVPLKSAQAHLQATFICGRNGKPMAQGTELGAYLGAQLVEPVDFLATARCLADFADLLIEVGPKQVLTDLVNDTLDKQVPMIALGAGSDAMDGALRAIGRAFTSGHAIDAMPLFEGRLIRPYLAPSARTYIESYCERPMSSSAQSTVAPTASREHSNLNQNEPGMQRRGDYVSRVLRNLSASMSASQDSPTMDLETAAIKAGKQLLKASLANGLAHVAKAMEDALVQSGQPAATIAPQVHATAPKVGIDAAAPATETREKQAPDTGASAMPILVAELVRQTGYDAALLVPEARLFDTLNLDSIKSGALVARVAKKLGIAGKIQANKFANATLREIAQAIDSEINRTAAQSASPAAAVPSQGSTAAKPAFSQQTLEKALATLVTEATGYQEQSFSAESRMLDDLRIDSIKVAALVSKLAKQNGVAGKVQTAAFANASLKDIAAAVFAEVQKTNSQQPAPAQPQPAATPAQPITATEKQSVSAEPSWVRTFGMRMVEVKGTDAPSLNFRGAHILVLHEESSASNARVLAKHLESIAGKVSCLTYNAAVATQMTAPFAHVFALQPCTPAVDSSDESAIGTQFERHLTAAKMARNNDSGPYATLTFVTFDGGLLGLGKDTPHYSVGSAVGFSRCVFIEGQSFDADCAPRGRVISLPHDCDMTSMARVVAKEAGGAQDYHEVGYTADGRRWEPREVIAEPGNYPELTTFSAEDVLLVTGGGKGITPACAFALAQSAKIKNVALLGRSPAPASNTDDELSRNIRMFNDNGMRCTYYVCDITDPKAIERTVKVIQREIGPIGAILHGAGTIRPCLTRNMTTAGVLKEIAGKALGATYLCRLLEDAPPKLLVGLGSIAQAHGLAWSSSYAYSIDVMHAVFSGFAARHKTRAITVGYAVWAKLGAAPRLGSVDHYASSGKPVWDMQPQEAAKRLGDVLNDPNVGPMPLITARNQNYPTWQFLRPRPQMDLGRFIEKVVSCEPDVELQARGCLHPRTDTFLSGHIYKNMYVLPTVFAQEMIAQAAVCLCGPALRVTAIENFSMPLPIVVDPQVGEEYEIRAVRRETSMGEVRVHVEIVTAQSGFSQPYVIGDVVLRHARQASVCNEIACGRPLPINLDTEIYGRHWFVNGPFQRMREVYRITDDGALCRIGPTEPQDPCFGAFAGPHMPLILGDPFARDAALHSGSLSDLQNFAFTQSIENIAFFEPQGSPLPCFVECTTLHRQSGVSKTVAITIYNEQWERLYELSGYTLRFLGQNSELPDHHFFLARREIESGAEEHLTVSLGAIVEHVRDFAKEQKMPVHLEPVPKLVATLRPQFRSLEKAKRHTLEATLAMGLLKGVLGSSKPDATFGHTQKGRPQFVGADDLGLSISHADPLCLMVTGPTDLGCDLARVEPRASEDWRGLLGDTNFALLEALEPIPMDQAGTHVWAADEALRKGPYAAPSIDRLEIVKTEGNIVIFRPHGVHSCLAVTCLVSLPDLGEYVLALGFATMHEKQQAVANGARRVTATRAARGRVR